MEDVYKLTGFLFRGLGEQVRLLLHDQCIPFQDNKLTSEQWDTIKLTMQFNQLPCLQDGEHQIVQSGAIMRHLARKHDLYGDSENDHTATDIFFEGVKDLHAKYLKLIYQEYDEKKEEFVTAVLPVELANFEKLLHNKTGTKGFVLGDKITFADYALYDELSNLLILDNKILDVFPTLKSYHEQMNGRPNLQIYLKQRELAKVPVNANGKQ